MYIYMRHMEIGSDTPASVPPTAAGTTAAGTAAAGTATLTSVTPRVMFYIIGVLFGGPILIVILWLICEPFRAARTFS